ncbi:MAG: hypothetical protein Q9165_003984 [Trypethelium subeluteriae]
MASQSSKIFVTGSINGQFRTVFDKIAALHAKNNFSFGIIAGDLFADPLSTTAEDEEHVTALLDGKVEIALPLYFAIGASALPDRIVEKLESNGGEVCTNLYFLGKRTTIKTSEGIKITALGGSLDPNIIGVSKDKYPPFYNEEDAKVLQEAQSTELLVTSQWPLGIGNGSKVELTRSNQVEQPCIADLCSTLKPKYHFSTTPTSFYEREPFFHPATEAAPDAYSVTRFISLAPFGNPHKAKWIYALNLDPQAAPPVTIPTGTTASPLSFNPKKRSTAEPAPFSRFAQEDTHSHSYPGPHTDRYRPFKRSRRAPPPTPSECYFCLSSPTLATHLITSIGSDVYLTTSKGPLSTAKTFPSLPFPGHMLIIPLTHSPTIASISDPDSRRSTYQEMRRYQAALNSMLADRAAGALGSVTWEVSRSRGIHTHWQYLPVSAELVRKGLVDAAFKVDAENQKFPVFRTGDPGDGLEGAPEDFFRLVVWAPESESKSEALEKVGTGDENGRNGAGEGMEMKRVGDVGEATKGKETKMYLVLDESFRFDLQFGRRVMAKLLGLESRMQWQDCGQSHEDEVGDAEGFKKVFKAFDFSLEE